MIDSGWVIQAVLYLNIFIIGVLLTIGFHHWRAHRQPEKPTHGPEQNPVVPKSIRAEIITDARKQYEQAILKTADELDKNLTTTNAQLKKALEHMRQSITAQESERYQAILNKIRNDTATAVSGAAGEVAEHQKALRQHFRDHQDRLDEVLEAEAEKTAKELREQRQELAKRQAHFESQMAQVQARLQSAFQKRQTELSQTQAAIEAGLMENQQQQIARQQQADAQLNTYMIQRRDQLLAQLDNQTADIILGFLEDVLGTSAPSGAEAASLTALLDEHKEELLNSIRGSGS